MENSNLHNTGVPLCHCPLSTLCNMCIFFGGGGAHLHSRSVFSKGVVMENAEWMWKRAQLYFCIPVYAAFVSVYV